MLGDLTNRFCYKNERNLVAEVAKTGHYITYSYLKIGNKEFQRIFAMWISLFSTNKTGLARIHWYPCKYLGVKIGECQDKTIIPIFNANRHMLKEDHVVLSYHWILAHVVVCRCHKYPLWKHRHPIVVAMWTIIDSYISMYIAATFVLAFLVKYLLC